LDVSHDERRVPEKARESHEWAVAGGACPDPGKMERPLNQQVCTEAIAAEQSHRKQRGANGVDEDQ
jgi:hypothetical protein